MQAKIDRIIGALDRSKPKRTKRGASAAADDGDGGRGRTGKRKRKGQDSLADSDSEDSGPDEDGEDIGGAFCAAVGCKSKGMAGSVHPCRLCAHSICETCFMSPPRDLLDAFRRLETEGETEKGTFCHDHIAQLDAEWAARKLAVGGGLGEGDGFSGPGGGGPEGRPMSKLAAATVRAGHGGGGADGRGKKV